MIEIMNTTDTDIQQTAGCARRAGRALPADTCRVIPGRRAKSALRTPLLAVLVGVVTCVCHAFAEPALVASLECGTVTKGGGVTSNGSVGVIGQTVAGKMTGASFTIDVGIVPCLGPGGTPPVTGCPGGTADECADAVDGNGVTDDVCTWFACDPALACDALPKLVPADMGGSFGACDIDGFCNVHDRNHALNCFSGGSACDTINVDAGGSFGACAPDGFCNVHDANHALTCFAGSNPCSCATGPTCGDGSLDPGEECDDGNTNPGDGCDAFCLLESPCGNASCEPAIGEDPCTCPADCGPQLPIEGPGPECLDGIDNDCNGDTDCVDANCAAEPLCQSTNDDCLAAIPLPPDPLVVIPFDTTLATTDGAPVLTPGCGLDFDLDPQIYNDVWFLYDGGACLVPMLATVNTCGAMFDTKIAVYDMSPFGCLPVCPPDDSLLVACDADGCDPGSFAQIPPFSPCMMIRVGGSGPLDAGPGELVIECMPSSPAPEPPGFDGATLTAVPDQGTVKPGDAVQVRVFMDHNGPDRKRGGLLQSYQLHLNVSGGRRGSLDLVEIAIEDRGDFVFDASAGVFDAYNVEKGQMLAGLDDGNAAVLPDAYLATFTYRVSPDAVGSFVIDVMHDEANDDQTFLVGPEPTDKIDVVRTSPAVISVSPKHGVDLR